MQGGEVGGFIFCGGVYFSVGTDIELYFISTLGQVLSDEDLTLIAFVIYSYVSFV